MLTIRSLLGFAVFSLAALSAVAQQPVSLGGETERYRIGFQDVLDVQVFRHPELNQRVSVSPTGTITLFRLENPIVAVCKTDRELAIAIADAYREKYLRDPQVNVVVAEQRSQPVAVIGAVEKPGSFYLSRKVHLLELLAMAGGPNKEAGTRLIVARTGNVFGCRTEEDNNNDLAVLDFKIRDIQEGKRTFWLQPGDVVSVLDSDVIYVYGNVNKQGSIRVREPITLTQALASSEGLKPTAKKDRVRILRQSQGSAERQEIVFDLNQIDRGKVNDPFLEPNDIVAVSEDRVKSILQGVANSLRSSIPSAIYRIP
jgi:polysaccharide export outer membrane protein